MESELKTVASCEKCGAYFYREPDELWKRYCLDCWIEWKNRDRIAELEAENEELWEKIWTLERKLGEPEFPDSIWRFLISVAHPDKHGNSVESNNATRWLLDFREKCKAGNGNAGHAGN